MKYTQELKKWNAMFYKNCCYDIDNIPQEHKAQAVSIKNCPDDCITIHSLTLIKKNERITSLRLWGYIKPEDYVKILKPFKVNRGLYELIREGKKRKVYFDIDGTDNTVFDKCMEIIKGIFPHDAEYNISGNKENNSYHIVVNNYYFDNLEQQNRMKAFLAEKYNDIFDTRVYTKNRLMKSINQRKVNSTTKEEYYKQEYISGSKDVKDHIITAFFPENAKNASDFFPKIKYDNITKKWVINKVKQMNLKLPDKNFNFYDATEEEILSIIPAYEKGNEFCLGHEHTWAIAIFCKHSGLSFDTFWSWAQKKDNSITRQRKWLDYWESDKLNNPKYVFKRADIGKFLERFYPSILNDKKELQFKRSHNIKATKIIESQYINYTDFTDKKVQVLALGLGANKTGSMIDFIKNKLFKKKLDQKESVFSFTDEKEENEGVQDDDETSPSYIIMTPRITLGFNMKGRMETEGLKPVMYNQFKSRKDKEEKLPKQDKLIIQLNSLKYLETRTKNYDYVIIDEVESILNIWHENKTLEGETLKKCWDVFKRILINGKKIILIDALLSRKTINLMNNLGFDDSDIEIIKRKKEPKPRDIVYIPLKHGKPQFKLWEQNIIQDLLAGKKVFVFYPYNNGNSSYDSMQVFCEKIKTFCHAKGKNINTIFYTGNTSDKDKKNLEKVNEIWNEYHLVCTNTCITVGVNYDNPTKKEEFAYDVAYIAYSTFVNPRDIAQVSMRIRELRDNTVKLINLGGFNQKDIIKGYEADTIHKKLLDDIILEKQNHNFTSLKMLMKMANYVVKTDDTLKQEIDKDFFFEYEKIWSEYGVNYRFSNIELINHIEAEELYKKIWEMNASFEDKLKLQKYNFLYLLKDGIDDDKLDRLWINRSFLITYNDINKENWINDLLKELNITIIDLPSKINISKELRSYIFKNIKFNKLNPDCSNEMLISRALTSYFRMKAYNYEYDENKNGKYIMDDKFLESQTEAIDNLRIYNEVQKVNLFTDE
jgi:hypothetical protein